MHARSFDARFRWIFIAPFVVAVAMLAGLDAASIDILSGARAYVSGESRWSKSEKDAVYHLAHYSTSHDDADYQKFLDALAVPLGDRQARLELDRPDPDLNIVRQGFVRGGNHPDDIDSMIRLYRRFRHVEFMAQAIDTWAEADAQIAEMQVLAGQIRDRLNAGDAASPQMQELRDRVLVLNEQLTRLGERFSSHLGAAARIAESLVLWTTLLTGAALAAIGMGLTAHLMRRAARTARALREGNERWTLATEAAGIGVFDWDLGRDSVTVDARSAALYGLPHQDSVIEGGRLSRELVHPDDAPRLRQALQNTIDNPAPLHIRYRVVRPDGAQRHLQLDARTRARGEVTRLIGILSDVSDDVQAQQLRLDKEGAERANRAKGAFLSRVSHELRTPLNAVLGFAELLQTDPHETLTPTQRQRLQHVLDSGRHLLELINDILDLTGLEGDTLRLQMDEVPLLATLQASLARVAPMAQAAGVTTACHAADDAAASHMQADGPRLEQALGHLLSNAIKYNRRGGRVDVGLRREDGHAVVTVTDTGAGMSPKQLARLFQPFDRLGAENTKVTGSGLGLMITQQLAQRMRGTLHFTSEPGRGTCAELRLPLATPAQGGGGSGHRPRPLDPSEASQAGGGFSWEGAANADGFGPSHHRPRQADRFVFG